VKFKNYKTFSNLLLSTTDSAGASLREHRALDGRIRPTFRPDRVVALDHGIKIAEGSFDAVATNEKVVEAYLGLQTAATK